MRRPKQRSAKAEGGQASDVTRLCAISTVARRLTLNQRQVGDILLEEAQNGLPRAALYQASKSRRTSGTFASSASASGGARVLKIARGNGLETVERLGARLGVLVPASVRPLRRSTRLYFFCFFASLAMAAFASPVLPFVWPARPVVSGAAAVSGRPDCESWPGA